MDSGPPPGPLACQRRWRPLGEAGHGAVHPCPRPHPRGQGPRAPAVQLQLRFFSEEALSRRLLTLPLCNTHYRNDRVFSLITHYFYAERRLLTKGKNNSNNIHIYGAANSHNILLFVQNSPMYKATM